jgi:hypothetical protein
MPGSRIHAILWMLTFAAPMANADFQGFRDGTGDCRTAEPPPLCREDSFPVVHPGVFSMIVCWLSDTGLPVATEINLDAAALDDDQFFGEVSVDGEWFRVDDAETGGFQRYRVLGMEYGCWVVEYQRNGGGTLTTSDEIVVSLHRRSFGKNLSPPGGSLVLRVETLRRDQ